MNKQQYEQAEHYRTQKQMFLQMELESSVCELMNRIRTHQITQQTIPSTLINVLDGLQFLANRLIHQLKDIE